MIAKGVRRKERCANCSQRLSQYRNRWVGNGSQVMEFGMLPMTGQLVGQQTCMDVIGWGVVVRSMLGYLFYESCWRGGWNVGAGREVVRAGP